MSSKGNGKGGGGRRDAEEGKVDAGKKEGGDVGEVVEGTGGGRQGTGKKKKNKKKGNKDKEGGIEASHQASEEQKPTQEDRNDTFSKANQENNKGTLNRNTSRKGKDSNRGQGGNNEERQNRDENIPKGGRMMTSNLEKFFSSNKKETGRTQTKEKEEE